MLSQIISMQDFYLLVIKIIVSFLCGFLIGIERTRVSAQYGARDHIFFSIISTSLIILYDRFLPSTEGFTLIIIIFGGMILLLLIGNAYRLFRENDPGYTTTLSMILSLIVGVICYYNEYLAVVIAVFFLIILSTKKQFNKIKTLQDIEWTGTIEFIAIVALLYILIPDNLLFFDINLKSVVVLFIIILAVKYFSYFFLKSTNEKNLYYISFLGGFAHSEATTVELAEAGASSSSIWLVIQTMLVRMLIVLTITPNLLIYALYPILVTSLIGLISSFLILKNKQTRLVLEKIRSPISLKSAFIFAATYLFALIISIVLSFLPLNVIIYFFIVFGIGFLSGGASSLFVASAYYKGLVNSGNALIMLAIGLSAACLNKIFYSLRALDVKKKKHLYLFHLVIYISITIFLLVILTIFTILIFNLPYF